MSPAFVIVIVVVFVTFTTTTTSTAATNRQGIDTETILYVQKYVHGYLSNSGNNTQLSFEEGEIRQAISLFQEYYQIPGDGTLNNYTLYQMRKPRCGLPDILHHEQNTGRKKWAKTHLTWNFHLTDVHTLKTTSFMSSEFVFIQRKTLNPDILISYRDYLLNMLTHEIGHALGLTHSSREDSIMFAFVTASNNIKIVKLNIEDILAIQQLYGIKNSKLTTTTQPPTSTTTEITTNKPEYVDLCTLQYVDTILVLHHRIFVLWSINIDDTKYDGPHILSSYMNFVPENFSLSAAYQRSSGELVLFVNNIVYMIEYPSFKLKEGWPKRLSSLGFPPNTLIDTVVNTNRGQTYAIFNSNDVAQIDECSMSVRSLQAVFPGIPSAPTLAFRYINGNLHQIAHRPTVHILERRYPLTVTDYKYLNVGINVTLPSYVTIILGDCHGKEIPLSPDIWRELLEQKHVILSLLQYDENNKEIRAPSPMYVGNLTLRFERINNLPILRLETSTARLSMSKSTVLNIFTLEHCVNRLISSLTAMTDNVDKKFSRLLAIASTVTKSANVLKTMYDNESFDRNDILDCELIVLIFGDR
ncbi:MMP3 protein, partial [Acromyrmex heyeri]